MTMPCDPDLDEVIWCDICQEPKRKLNYRLQCGERSAVWICERCEADEAALSDEAEAEAEALAEADALQKSFEAAMTARREYLHAIFRDHNCARCQDGRKACVQGDPNRCMWPVARND